VTAYSSSCGATDHHIDASVTGLSFEDLKSMTDASIHVVLERISLINIRI
jgi:hypothetical protein